MSHQYFSILSTKRNGIIGNKKTTRIHLCRILKEDSVGSGSKIYTWKNQSAQTDPMAPELETHSIKDPINSLSEDIKIISEFNPCHPPDTISSENFKMNKAFEKKFFVPALIPVVLGWMKPQTSFLRVLNSIGSIFRGPKPRNFRILGHFFDFETL